MNKQRVRMTAWCLGLILVAGSSLQTMASEDGRTYEEYRQGAQNTGEAREETRTEENLQVIELEKQQHKGEHAEQQHQQHSPAADNLIGPPGSVTPAFFRHGSFPFWFN